jgi:GNAT superfamily N-acetyltransferase
MSLKITRAGKEHAGVMAEYRFKMFEEIFVEDDYLGKRDSFIEECREYYSKHIDDEDNLSFIALLDGRLAGCASIQFELRPPHIRFGGNYNGYILNVYVDKDFRKKGIATRLMERLHEEAAARGAKRIGLHASQYGNPVYAKIGYKTTEKYMELILK